MITREEYNNARKRALKMFKDAGMHITEKEYEDMSVVDFGLSNLEIEGAEIVTYFNTERIACKILALFPNQTEPEHWHTSVGTDPGKEEIVRVISGVVRFYIPGEDNMKEGKIPDGKEDVYTCRNEIIMKRGDQIILEPGLKHWFQTDEKGAVMYTFSSCARDLTDKFTDPAINRDTIIKD